MGNAARPNSASFYSTGINIFEPLPFILLLLHIGSTTNPPPFSEFPRWKAMGLEGGTDWLDELDYHRRVSRCFFWQPGRLVCCVSGDETACGSAVRRRPLHFATHCTTLGLS